MLYTDVLDPIRQPREGTGREQTISGGSSLEAQVRIGYVRRLLMPALPHFFQGKQVRRNSSKLSIPEKTPHKGSWCNLLRSEPDPLFPQP